MKKDIIPPITTSEALKIAEERGVPVTRPTVIAWCERYKGLARKVGGRWKINKKRYALILDGKTWENEQ